MNLTGRRNTDITETPEQRDGTGVPGVRYMITRSYKINPKNSSVLGQPGRHFDWSKFCWDGSEIYRDDCGRPGHPVDEQKAPQPYVDDCLIGPNSQYLHVPYNFAEERTVYRVRPNTNMQAGGRYRGLRVIRQTAVQKEGAWYWVLEGEE